MRPFYLWFLLLAASTVSIAARPRIVTTHTVLADFARVIGEELVDVDCILPNSADPHTYEPKPNDVRRLARADLVVENGFGLEPWAEKLIQNSGFKGEVLVVGETIPDSLRIPALGESNSRPDLHWDPHAWQNPTLASRYIDAIAAALSRIDKANTAHYQLAAEAYQRQLSELDTYAAKKFAAVPPSRRQIVTTHDSLQYLAKHYNFQIISVIGPLPGHEPTAREMGRIVQQISAVKAPAVFLESTASPKIAEIVAFETKKKIAPELFTDSLGPIGSGAETYLGMFKLNVDTIAQALE